MKKLLLSIIPVLLLSAFVQKDNPKASTKDFMAPGEKIEYRVHYGFVNAGEATIQVHPEMYVVNNKICYKATCFGKSSGAFDMITRIRDTWGSYIDTIDFLPQRSYRDITEGRHKLKEGVYFYHNKGIAEAEREKRGKTTKYTYTVPFGVQDIVSGYFYLRKFDFNKMHAGDTIKLSAFFEDQMYDFKVKYLGKQRIKTKFGSINTFKLTPIMPDNDLFKGENAIKLYLSDDKNKVAVKIEAEMFVGAVEIELKSYQGLKNPINFKKD